MSEITCRGFPYSVDLLKENLELIPYDMMEEQFGDRMRIKGWYAFFKYEEDYLVAKLMYD